MRVILVHANRVAYKPSQKGLDNSDPDPESRELKDLVMAFIHVEKEDEERAGKVVTNLIKNIKWLCGKLGTKRVLLHSFAHLSKSKASPEFSREVLKNARERLENVGYEVYETPFGYFLDIEISMPGHSLGRIYKEI
jgi:hypothetical protein